MINWNIRMYNLKLRQKIWFFTNFYRVQQRLETYVESVKKLLVSMLNHIYLIPDYTFKAIHLFIAKLNQISPLFNDQQSQKNDDSKII